MKRWLTAALVVGLLARLPGVFWGFNWPGADRFAGHHPDEWTHVVNAEVVMNPNLPPRYEHPYPKALGAIVGAPVLAWSLLHGSFGGNRPSPRWTILVGRLVSVTFALGAIFMVFLIGRDVLGSERIGVLAAWLLALGGLHVTQSHFFVADVPVTTWLLLSLWLMWRDTQSNEGSEALRWAAFFTGAAFAMKLFFFSFPALGLVTLRRGPRLRRVVHVLVFAATGFWISSLGFDTPLTFARVLGGGTNDPYIFDRVKGAILYLVQLPGMLSFPLLVLAALGAVSLFRHIRRSTQRSRVMSGLIIFGTVPLITLLFILLMADHFPRHWVPLIPWAALLGAWALDRGVQALQDRGRSPVLLVAPVILWMAALVVDSERGFVAEPRNDALRWLYANADSGSTLYWSRHGAPRGFVNLRWQNQGDPDYLVIEMYDANNFLSGINWRNSYPADPKAVFDVENPERLRAFQSLFKGELPYREVARFSEAYVMPEHRLSMWLVGDRARSYLTEVVIFRHSAGSAPPVPSGAS
jgi:hypothetical protein